MKKNNSIFLFFLLAACSSFPTEKTHLNLGLFERVEIGDESQRVISILGKPEEVMKGNERNPDDLWVYVDKTGAQRGAVSVKPSSQIVTAVTFIPDENEPEYHLDFLLKSKFRSSTFEKAPLQRCHRDYIPLEVFYIQTQQGIIIEANKGTDEVVNLSRSTPEDASDLLRKIRECKR